MNCSLIQIIFYQELLMKVQDDPTIISNPFNSPVKIRSAGVSFQSQYLKAFVGEIFGFDWIETLSVNLL